MNKLPRRLCCTVIIIHYFAARRAAGKSFVFPHHVFTMQSLCLISSTVCGNVEALEAPPLEPFIFMPLDIRSEHCLSSDDRLKIFVQRLINSVFFCGGTQWYGVPAPLFTVTRLMEVIN